MKRIKWLIASVLASMLVILSGCQSVGGLDINKSMVDSFAVKSSESKQTFSLEIVPALGQASEEDKKMIDLLNSFSLSIDHVKMQDASTASVEGSLSLDGKKVPFHVSVDKKEMIIWVQGAKKPVSIPLDTLNSAYGVDLASLQPSTEQSLKLITDVGKFFFKNAPNPESISLSTVTDTVYGEELSLKKLHVDVRGDELVGLAKSFLTGVSKDKEGVKELISTLYDVYYPIYESGLNMYSEEYLEEEYFEDKVSSFDSWESVIQDKEATVIYLTNQLQKVLNDILVDYDRDIKDLFEEEPLLNEVFSKDTVLSMDIMFDNKLQIRKQNVDLIVQLPIMEGIPVKQIKIHSKSEIWNVNKPVTINKVDTTQGALELDILAVDQITPGTLLRNFEGQSEAYRFLKEDMSITSKYVILETLVDEEYGWYYDYSLPIEVNRTTMVPLRHVAEQLDAEMKWDNTLKQATVIDDLTGSTIVLKNGSNQALVDGKKVKLAEPFMNYEGTYYVPLRFISDALGATVEWDNYTKSIIIERK
ncbi:copper amine oxidase N-terminal domain-containing protein [Paenibacillus sp. FA6]|uniref:copper amine oxidase N-terminal domain-containing protein n=1 Tax=Paenibacillus sp. FA6 TaxID=3413029 RepID=UPI003F65F4C2